MSSRKHKASDTDKNDGHTFFAIKIGEFEWAEQFVEKFQHYLDEKERKVLQGLQLLTVKVAVPPVHIVVLFTLGAGAGLGVTVTVAVAVPVPEQLPELTVQVAV